MACEALTKRQWGKSPTVKKEASEGVLFKVDATDMVWYTIGMEHRTVRLQSMVTPDEAAAIREFAASHGVGVSDLIRIVLMEYVS